MTVYTVRPGFTVRTPDGVFVGGDEVDLDELLFAANKHKLENVERDEELDIDFGVDDSDEDSGYPAPYVGSINPVRFLEGTTGSIRLLGSFFTPETTVEITGGTVNSIVFVNSLELAIEFLVGSSGVKNLTIDNGKSLTIESAIEVKSQEDAIVDLRSGGTPFTEDAIEVRNDMSWERTPQGLLFRGRNPFGSWARLVGDGDAWVWNRSESRNLSLIFTHSSSFMLGIGSRANNVSSTQQFSQAEIMAYFSSGVTFSGLYGNAGNPGVSASSTFSISLNGNGSGIHRIDFVDNGSLGSNVSLFELPSSNPSDWTDSSNPIGTINVSNSFTADEPAIMPFLIPRDGNATLFLGFLLY